VLACAGCRGSGGWQGTARAQSAWEAAGCRYEHAAALAESPEPDDLLTALGILDELGATPLATLIRRRLRALGTTRIPRGPRGETKDNPAGLTVRQIDVLRLLGQRLSCWPRSGAAAGHRGAAGR
jgi:hypothetical protein